MALHEDLTAMATSCPPLLFQQEHQASASTSAYDLTGVEITKKHNLAPPIASLVLQTVTHNKRWHDTLQRSVSGREYRPSDTAAAGIEQPIPLAGTC